jgi:hypothetical protein
LEPQFERWVTMQVKFANIFAIESHAGVVPRMKRRRHVKECNDSVFAGMRNQPSPVVLIL